MKTNRLNQYLVNKPYNAVISSSGAFMMSTSENIPVKYGISIGN